MSTRLLRSFMLFLVCIAIFVHGSDDNIKTLMEIHQIVPDFIAEAPQLTLIVIYEGGVIVENGIELTPTQVKNQPLVTWDPDSGTFYTLILVNPDVPTRTDTKMKESPHWLVVNIPGNDISKGDVLAEYLSAGPPEGTSLHRFIFLLYKQSTRMIFDEERLLSTTLKGRFYFSTQKFVEKYNLGDPIAANFFQTQYDEYVPELFKRLGYIYNNDN